MTPGFIEMPTAVLDHRLGGVLELRWPDGARSLLPHALLRAKCRCAGCEQARRQGVECDADDPRVRLADLLPVSDKGLNLVFNDGHGRGIYPWNYLRDLGNA